jgi:hypothetical protein
MPSMSPIATDRSVRTRNESCLQFDTNAFLAASDNRSMSPIATDRSVRTRNESCLQLDTNAFLAASDNRF